MQRKILQIAVAFSILIDALIAAPSPQNSPPLGALVPAIQQPYWQLTPSGNQYHLVLNHPNGSNRDEVVELRSPGTSEEELFVNGTISNIYDDTNGEEVIMYEAGKNGYLVKYKYTKATNETAPIRPLFLSPRALQSAAG